LPLNKARLQFFNLIRTHKFKFKYIKACLATQCPAGIAPYHYIETIDEERGNIDEMTCAYKLFYSTYDKYLDWHCLSECDIRYYPICTHIWTTDKKEHGEFCNMTMTMQWNETMKVHVVKIDEQHRNLISIIKSLHDTLESDKAGDAEKEILVELIRYTDYHFSMEKELMEKHNYPQIHDHLALHKEFTDKLKEFCTKHQGGNSGLSRDMLAFLVRWLINHIMNVDKKLGGFLNQRGIK